MFARLLVLAWSCAVAEPWFWATGHAPAAWRRMRPWSSSDSVRTTTVRLEATVQATAVEEQEAPQCLRIEDAAIQRPDLDSRSYRITELANGLVVLLVSDEAADEAGAALSIKAGSFDDTRMGLAHFHEHMLFLGTAKYPGEDEYEEYLSAHGGGSNAYTGDEETCFYLSVNADALEGALDRFAQFFVAPLFAISSVEREVKAVDSEHRMSLSDDNWRLMSVLKTAADPGHPFSRFATGTEETLLGVEQDAAALVEELKRWHGLFYRSEAMRLVVVGKESLEELESLVSSDGRFGAISAGTPYKRPTRPEPFAPVATVTEAVSVRTLRSLQLAWPIPGRSAIRAEYGDDATPELVLSHLLGHEASSSLHAKLRGEGLIESLSVGTSARFDDGQLFEISVELTEEGAEEVDSVILDCFRWIGLLNRASEAELERASEELKKMHETRFKFSERRGGAADYAAEIAEHLWDYPQQPIAGPWLCGTFNYASLKSMVGRLTPESLMITQVRPSVDDFDEDDGEWLAEKWHGAKYRTFPLKPEVLAPYAAALLEEETELALPGKNVYVTREYDIFDDSKEGVYRLTPHLWRRADSGDAPDDAKSPRAQTFVLLRDSAVTTAASFAKAEVMCAVVAASLNSEAYDASLAGSSFAMEATRSGILLRISSFAAHSERLLELALKSLREHSLDADEAAFEVEREELQRRYEDASRDDASGLASAALRLAMRTEAITADEISLALKTTTLAAASKELAEKLDRSSLEMYVAGNVHDDRAHELAKAAHAAAGLLEQQKTSPNEPPRALLLPVGDLGVAVELRSLRLSEASGTRFLDDDDAASPEGEDDEDPNSAVEVSWQVGRSGDDEDAVEQGWASSDVRDAAATLVGRLAGQSAFNQLRTIEQLGYLAEASVDAHAGVIGLRCLVQSPNHSPLELEARIEAWVATFRSQIAEMTEDQVAEKREGLADLLTQRASSLREVTSRDWHEISSRRRSFGHARRRATHVRGLTKSDLERVLDTYLVLGAPLRRCLKSRLFSPDRATERRKTAISSEEPRLLRSLADVESLKAELPKWKPPLRRNEGDIDNPAL